MGIINEKLYIPIEEAAKALGIEERELREMKRLGILPGKYKAGVFCVNLPVLSVELGREYDRSQFMEDLAAVVAMKRKDLKDRSD